MALLREETPAYKITKGTNYLADVELLGLIISGDAEKANQKARDILSVTQLSGIGKLSLSDLQKIGLTKPEASRVVACIEIARRRDISDLATRPRISSSRDGYNVIGATLKDLQVEEFWVIYLNKACDVIGRERISVGGTAGTVADIKIIFQKAIENKASAIIAAHNHPSGNLKPSDADVDLTRKMKEAGKILELLLLDHLIISERGYYSFADEGVI
jgi:DNA repair protein RadC